MPVKISEKKLFTSIIFLAVGVFILLNASVITTPFQVSERGALFTVLACCLIIFSLILFRRSATKI